MDKLDSSPPTENIKYSAKLLFQFVFDEDKENCFSTCELRIINFFAESDDLALIYAQEYGVNEEYISDSTVCPDPYSFKFIGVLDIQDLGSECGEEVVFYDIIKMKNPMARKNKIIPSKQKLKLFR